MKFLITHMQDWYGRYERPIYSISLVGGFIFDAFTLKRIDFFWENFYVVIRLIAVAIFIILINLQENKATNEKDASKKHFWHINILQFLFGGLLGTFVVFYFRSATLAVTWPFLLILLIAFVANESLKKHYARLIFQINFFFLSLLSFAIFIVPVFFHRIGSDIFLISGFISLAILGIFLLGLKFLAKEKFKESEAPHTHAHDFFTFKIPWSETPHRLAWRDWCGGKKPLFLSISGIFFATNILYFLNLIPPIPLSLKDAGIYHSLVRNESGNYIAQFEDKGWLGYFDLSEDFHAVPGNPIYAYSAIFSPTLFDNDIAHVWQKYDSNINKWVTITKINLSATGGREGGFRTYSMKSNIISGEWRVNVETSGQQVIGRLRFNVIETNTNPILKTDIKI